MPVLIGLTLLSLGSPWVLDSALLDFLFFSFFHPILSFFTEMRAIKNFLLVTSRSVLLAPLAFFFFSTDPSPAGLASLEAPSLAYLGLHDYLLFFLAVYVLSLFFFFFLVTF